MQTQSEFGAWPSPWTPERVSVGGSFPQFWIGQLAAGEGGRLFALVRRPSEGGRSVIVRLDGETPADLTPPGVHVNTRIIEYGGSAFVADGDTLYFIAADQRWHRRDPDGAIMPITEAGDVRYGAPLFDRHRRRIVCVREDHRGVGEPVNTIVAVDPAGDAFGTVLVEGDDFYAWPALSPDGTRLAWVSWNHPRVPWDVTALSEGRFGADGRIAETAVIVPERDEVACDPQYSPGGRLVFCSDRSGWWNYYGWDGQTAQNLYPAALEFARPIWLLGTSDYRFIDEDTILGVFTEEGANRLGRLDLKTRTLTTLDLPYSYFARLQVEGDHAYALASSPALPAAVVALNLKTGARRELLVASDASDYAGAISEPRHIAFPSVKGRTGYGFFYPPRNDGVAPPAGGKPPLLVLSHGGPTGCTNVCFNPGIQFWTSRGFAVFDINYAGSTGYGRAFRHLLRGGWGVVDVEDHVAAARYLVEAGLVDGRRLAVRGWSAGGYNTFAALAFADTFHAGAAYFGISDAMLWAEQTHKFEAHYPDYLVGPRSDTALYRERSPLPSAGRIAAPLAMFQGADDKITPPNQSELILESLRARGVPVMYMLFQGEGHGFRKAETNLACLKAELAFYGRVFGFTPADELPPIPLENAERLKAAR